MLSLFLSCFVLILICSDTSFFFFPVILPPAFQKVSVPAPEEIQVTTSDGATLYGHLYCPDGAPTLKEAKALAESGRLHELPPPRPCVVYVYGGPGVQVARNQWAARTNLRLQAIRERGAYVMMVDNR